MIGAAGGKIKEIRDKFNQVQITFPDSIKKSDVVTLRGPKTDVDKAFKYLTQMNKEMVSLVIIVVGGDWFQEEWEWSVLHFKLGNIEVDVVIYGKTIDFACFSFCVFKDEIVK